MTTGLGQELGGLLAPGSAPPPVRIAVDQGPPHVGPGVVGSDLVPDHLCLLRTDGAMHAAERRAGGVLRHVLEPCDDANEKSGAESRQFVPHLDTRGAIVPYRPAHPIRKAPLARQGRMTVRVVRTCLCGFKRANVGLTQLLRVVGDGREVQRTPLRKLSRARRHELAVLRRQAVGVFRDQRRGIGRRGLRSGTRVRPGRQADALALRITVGIHRCVTRIDRHRIE